MTRSALLLWWIPLIFFAAWSPAVGQEAPTGRITYADGDEFIIVRDDQPVRYAASPAVAEGVQLRPGDYLITEDGTTIEIQLGLEGAVVQVLENTSLEVSSLDASGRALLTVDYGRLRLISTGTDTSDAVTIMGPHVVAQGGTARAAYGVTVAPDTAGGPTTEIECYEGSLRLESRETAGDGERDADEPDRYVVLQRNQAFEVATSATIAAGTKRRLSGQERSTWEQVAVLGSGVSLAQADEDATDAARQEEAPDAVATAEDPEKPRPDETQGDSQADDDDQDARTTAEPVPSAEDDTGGGFLQALVLETGVDAVAWGLTTTDMQQLASLGGGAGWLANLALILLTLRVGPVVDLMYEPAPFFGVGLGTGFLSLTWGEGADQSIPFLVPATLSMRFSLGPVFLQPFAGALVSGVYTLSTQGLATNVGGGGGAKLGVRLGRVTVAVAAGLAFPTVEALTSFAYLYQFGLSGSFRFGF